MIKGVLLRHIGITVSNIDKSIEFYRDLLGLEIISDVIEDKSWIKTITNVQLRLRTVKLCDSCGGTVELLHYSEVGMCFHSLTDIGCSHIAFTVENLDNIYNKFIKFGINFISSPQSNDKVKVAFCFDPDNICIELVELLG